MADHVEYQTVLECTQDPCSYCQAPARRIILDRMIRSYLSENEAVEYGNTMARQVYGNEHRVLIQSRMVTDWSEPRKPNV